MIRKFFSFTLVFISVLTLFFFPKEDTEDTFDEEDLEDYGCMLSPFPKGTNYAQNRQQGPTDNPDDT
jgi:hypothetical protein